MYTYIFGFQPHVWSVSSEFCPHHHLVQVRGIYGGLYCGGPVAQIRQIISYKGVTLVILLYFASCFSQCMCPLNVSGMLGATVI
jgi:hypothetical protein